MGKMLREHGESVFSALSVGNGYHRKVSFVASIGVCQAEKGGGIS